MKNIKYWHLLFIILSVFLFDYRLLAEERNLYSHCNDDLNYPWTCNLSVVNNKIEVWCSTSIIDSKFVDAPRSQLVQNCWTCNNVNKEMWSCRCQSMCGICHGRTISIKEDELSDTSKRCNILCHSCDTSWED